MWKKKLLLEHHEAQNQTPILQFSVEISATSCLIRQFLPSAWIRSLALYFTVQQLSFPHTKHSFPLIAVWRFFDKKAPICYIGGRSDNTYWPGWWRVDRGEFESEMIDWVEIFLRESCKGCCKIFWKRKASPSFRFVQIDKVASKFLFCRSISITL